MSEINTDCIPVKVADRFHVQDEVALVTGGSRGLGIAMAHALGSAGARLVITARRQAELDNARVELEDAGYEVLAFRSDIGDLAAAPAIVDAALTAYGKIDILVNNAGATWGAPASEYPSEAWHKVFNVNVHGTWLLTKEVAVRSMIPRRHGAIVMVASIAGLGANTPREVPTVAYNASKAAQISLTRSLATEWGRYGVRVNAILPGLFPTKMTTLMVEEHGPHYIERAPLRRLGQADDIAGPVLFLASDASRYVTGACLTVDGGYTAVV